jgi:predicted DNA-binding transcriptional regulator AlpA
MTPSIDDPFITRPQARREYFGGVHRCTILRWEKSGKLPPPIRLTAKTVGWRRSVLERVLAEHQGCGHELIR